MQTVERECCRKGAHGRLPGNTRTVASVNTQHSNTAASQDRMASVIVKCMHTHTHAHTHTHTHKHHREREREREREKAECINLSTQ